MVATEIPIGLADIVAAAERIKGVAYRTELIAAPDVFRAQVGADLYLKMENMQRTGSFKMRGAYNTIASVRALPAASQPCGIIAASAGNHAQGIAAAAALAGFPATVVMPLTASLTKARACREMGAEVILHGVDIEEAGQRARQIAAEQDYLFVHPYDDWRIIAGQGTVGLEIAADLPDATTVVVPLGGGGLLSGTALALKSHNPKLRIVGVQTATVCPYIDFLRDGTYRRTPPGATTIADGIKVKAPGERTSALIRQHVDDIVTVTDDQISETIVAVLERTRTMIEGAGAVALAALLHGAVRVGAGERVVAVLSGGNIDTPLVGRVIDYGLSAGGRYMVAAVLIPDTPGQLVRMLTIVAGLGVNVRQVDHRRGEIHVPVGQTEVMIQMETRDSDEQAALLQALTDAGFSVRHMTYALQQLDKGYT